MSEKISEDNLVDHEIVDFLNNYMPGLSGRADKFDEAYFLIQSFMRKAAVRTKEDIEALLQKLYPSMAREKEQKISNLPLPLDLEVLDVPDSLRDPNEVILEIFKECPRAQNSSHFLQKELEKRGIKIVRE